MWNWMVTQAAALAMQSHQPINRRYICVGVPGFLCEHLITRNHLDFRSW